MIKNSETTINTEATTTNATSTVSFLSKVTSWIKSNPVEFYILATLVPAFILGFAMGVHATGFKELFKSVHDMHTNHINMSIEYFGFGAALFNAAGISLFYYGYGKITKVKWTASPFMSIMLVFGFSFYVLNFYAILFLLVGIMISSMIFKTTLDKSYGAATLSTCSTPIFAFLAFGSKAMLPDGTGVLLGGFCMILVTVMAQKIGGLVAKVNDGLTLANTGVSHGFLAVFFYTLILITGIATQGTGNDVLVDRLIPDADGASWVEGSTAAFMPYAANQWYLMVYMGSITTFLFALYWVLFPMNKGFMDVIRKDGKAPTDWFVVSGVREAAFNIWGFMMLSIILTGIWTGISGAEFGMNSNVSVAFLQAFAFAAYGQNLVGALLMTAGFYVAWYFTFAAGPNGGGHFDGVKWGSAWVEKDFMALVMFGWLLTPMIGVNIFAPFIAAIFHTAWHRMFGMFTGGFTYYMHGVSTFMSVVILLPFFQAINWVRTPRGALMSDITIAEANQSLERSKVVAMSTEVLYYLSDEGATDLSTLFEFGDSSSTLTVKMFGGNQEILEALAKKLNDYKRDRVMEYNMWSSLGANASTRNLALLAQMTDSATLSHDGEMHTLTLLRKRVKVELED